VGGPVTEASQDKLERTGWFSLVVVAVAAGFPHPQTALDASGVGRRRLDMIELLPPCRFLTVAMRQ